MKKIITIASCLLVAASVVFVSCEKDGNETPQSTTTTSLCKDSVYATLIADSLVCSGKNYFQIPVSATSYKLIAVDLGNTAIDTIIGNAPFVLAYDSIPGTTACKGAIFKNATLKCFKRL